MPANDPFKYNQAGVESPAIDLVSITKADADLPQVIRDLRVGTAGDVAVVTTTGVTVTFKGCVAGERLGPFRVAQVKATGTTAGDLVGYV